MTIEHNRRASDTLIIQLDIKIDQILEKLSSQQEWLKAHEMRIQDCEKQHVRIKTIVALVSSIITMLWAGIIYYLFDMRSKH